MTESPYWDDYDDEVDALWNGRLPMDRVLQTLQEEIEGRKTAEARVAELEAWRSVALSLGESWASHGPDGYYDMTPAQWLEWIDAMLEKREWDAQ